MNTYLKGLYFIKHISFFFAFLIDHVYVRKILGRSYFYGFWMGTVKKIISTLQELFLLHLYIYLVCAKLVTTCFAWVTTTYLGFPWVCMTSLSCINMRTFAEICAHMHKYVSTATKIFNNYWLLCAHLFAVVLKLICGCVKSCKPMESCGKP